MAINDEFKILKMFMNAGDKIGKHIWINLIMILTRIKLIFMLFLLAFEKLLKYTESNEEKLDDLEFIKEKYFDLI